MYHDVEVLAEAYQTSVKRGGSVKGSTWDQIGIHELGHALTVFAVQKANTSTEEMIDDWKKRKTAEEIVKTAYRNLNDDSISIVDMIKNISSYAEKSVLETIAEAFVEYYVNPEAKFSKEIIDELKRRL